MEDPRHHGYKHLQEPRSTLERRFERVIYPFRSFINSQLTASTLLLIAAVAALVWANSPWSEQYRSWQALNLALEFENWRLEHSLKDWVNHGLMTLFFLQIGLEIKREILAGELRQRTFAGLVITAAAGGVLIPAMIYFALGGSELRQGWAIPTATDTAFAISVLLLLQRRVGSSPIVFITALAIADDLAAILIISIWYTQALTYWALTAAAVIMALMYGCNLLGVRRTWVYAILGFSLWWLILQSGIHATVAGVLIALTIPALPRYNPHQFLHRTRRLYQSLARLDLPDPAQQPLSVLSDGRQRRALTKIKAAANLALPDIYQWENRLALPVSLMVLPLFALTNAGIHLASLDLTGLGGRAAAATAIALVIGKPLGITCAVALGNKLNLCALPENLQLKAVFAVACLAGIGFTMSTFIAELAFGNYPSALEGSKLGILIGSLLSGFIGYFLLRFWAYKDGATQRPKSRFND